MQTLSPGGKGGPNKDQKTKEKFDSRKDLTDKKSRVNINKVEKLKLEEEDATRQRFSIYSLEQKASESLNSPTRIRNRIDEDSPLSPSRATRHGGNDV